MVRASKRYAAFTEAARLEAEQNAAQDGAGSSSGQVAGLKAPPALAAAELKKQLSAQRRQINWLQFASAVLACLFAATFYQLKLMLRDDDHLLRLLPAADYLSRVW